jgi:two-component system sensor histidine kinase ChvG
MAPDIDTPKAEPAGLRLRWSGKLSLTTRILAVNLAALALMAAGLLFLDSYRTRLISERANKIVEQVHLLGRTLEGAAAPDWERHIALAARSGQTATRIRVYDGTGEKTADSLAMGVAGLKIIDPATQTWQKHVAASMDRIFDSLVMAPRLALFAEPQKDTADAWMEFTRRPTKGTVRIAEDSTHVVSATFRSKAQNFSILWVSNPRDIRALVRAERFSIGLYFLIVLAFSVLLSLFLARTIVRPLQHLANAAQQVRLGRSSAVHVPRLPSRRDEIGQLARALSDMSSALRQRIDATEAFAADVAHEIKNPLASLRSALDGLEKVSDPDLRKQLMGVAHDDVQRMDRLISDISDASRIDAQLAKARFERIDLGDMIEQLLNARESRGEDGNVTIAFARPRRDIAAVMGEDLRLERVFTNLLDNAVSFSPDNGVVEVSATCSDNTVIIRIVDQGPGIPENERENIFRRFHSERPTNEGFGKHSGLGLAIARTIIEGHHGTISVHDREDGGSGACFEIRLPVAGNEVRL